MAQLMTENPILSELYAVRAQILENHGDNLSAYLHAEFERLRAEGHPISEIPQRTNKPLTSRLVDGGCEGLGCVAEVMEGESPGD